MGKQKVKPNYRRRSLRLPDLDHCKRAVLNSLDSPASRRVYEYAIDQFIAWYRPEPWPLTSLSTEGPAMRRASCWCTV